MTLLLLRQRWLYDLPKHHFWIPVVSCCIGQEREDSTEASCNIAYGYPTWLGCIESSLDFFLNFKKNPSTFPAIMPPGLFALRALFYCRPCRPAAQRGASPASASAAAQQPASATPRQLWRLAAFVYAPVSSQTLWVREGEVRKPMERCLATSCYLKMLKWRECQTWSKLCA